MKTLYTIHNTNNRKSTNGFRKKIISPRKITLERHDVYTITQEEKIIQIRNNTKTVKNSTRKVEKDVEHDARIA